MKPLRLLILLCSFAAMAQSGAAYDKTLAQQLGADEYGMKKYVLVILKTGSNPTTDKSITAPLFAAHMDNISRLVADKKLVVAGPLMKNEKTYRGIFILDVRTIEEAKSLVASDPAIKEKLLDAEFFEWYGAAALPEYLEAQQKITLKQH